MMETLRTALSTLLFFSSLTLVALVFIGYVEGLYLLAALVGLFIAYYTWPRQKKAERDGLYAVLDILEILIELPIRLLGWLFGKLLRLVKDVDIGV